MRDTFTFVFVTISLGVMLYCAGEVSKYDSRVNTLEAQVEWMASTNKSKGKNFILVEKRLSATERAINSILSNH